MIRINREGLTSKEVDNVLHPLASNTESKLEIGSIGTNLKAALDRYGSVMTETVAGIDVDPAQR
jgi:hypothetical protein